MKKTTKHLRTLGVAVALAASFTPGAQAAIDTAYNPNDLLLFGLQKNSSGDAWAGDVVAFSLGSTYDVFRRAATPTDPTFGTVISLGNINTILTSSYGADWTGLAADKLYFGAVGQNGSTSALNTSVTNGDYSRTTYVTSPRLGAGTYGESNSGERNVPTANAAGTSGNIGNANNTTAGGQPNPTSVAASGTQPMVTGNALSGTQLGAAFGSIQGGVVGAASSSTYSYDTINNVVIGLDLFRITPNLNNVGSNIAWQNANSINADYGGTSGNGSAFYLGTITLSSNGDVNFVGTGATPIPEPGTIAAALLLAGGAWLRSRKRAQLAS